MEGDDITRTSSKKNSWDADTEANQGLNHNVPRGMTWDSLGASKNSAANSRENTMHQAMSRGHQGHHVTFDAAVLTEEHEKLQHYLKGGFKHLEQKMDQLALLIMGLLSSLDALNKPHQHRRSHHANGAAHHGHHGHRQRRNSHTGMYGRERSERERDSRDKEPPSPGRGPNKPWATEKVGSYLWSRGSKESLRSEQSVNQEVPPPLPPHEDVAVMSSLRPPQPVTYHVLDLDTIHEERGENKGPLPQTALSHEPEEIDLSDLWCLALDPDAARTVSYNEWSRKESPGSNGACHTRSMMSNGGPGGGGNGHDLAFGERDSENPGSMVAQDTTRSMASVDGVRHRSSDGFSSQGTMTSMRSQLGANARETIDHFANSLSTRADRISKFKSKNPVCITLWHFLDDPESSVFAFLYARFALIATLGAVCLSLLQASSDPPPLDEPMSKAIEMIMETYFLVEIMLRLFSCPRLADQLRRPYWFLDILSAVPLVMRITESGQSRLGMDTEVTVQEVVYVCVAPVIRLLRTLRYFEQFQLLISAFRMALNALPFLIFLLVCLVLVFSSLIFIFEPRENIESISHAMWLSLVTMTTVGYGDVYAVTTPGRLVSVFMIIAGNLYMAIPIGIIGAAFTEVWNDRDSILLRHRLKDRLAQWGYTADDVLSVFRMYDEDGSGVIDLEEFTRMLSGMKLGLSDQRVIHLFHSFETGKTGTITDVDFVKYLFPHCFHEVFGGKNASQPETFSGKLRLPSMAQIQSHMKQMRMTLAGGLSQANLGGYTIRSPRASSTIWQRN
eukprot:TRINITY_DN101904_c0_g1_i1.p1 TRINITY_DN101904_c0_g1~~TRINITY_DN101904_c0_g1_i1.p1  ORF type:complete len:788 (+),score=154.35 TRINITY_DN101904_c0_g1_i1:147-2510(+)